MSNKKEQKQQVRSDVTMLDELKQLKQELETYKKSGVEMGKEILSLKRQNAGLKGQIKQLQDRIEHYKRLDLEGDELNEEKIAKIESLKKELEIASKQAKRRGEVVDELKKKINEVKTENVALRATIEGYKAMPWYKRIFK